MTPDPRPPEHPPLAAEYVMGLLDAADLAAAERRLATDPAFAHDVAVWRGRFAELDATAEELPPAETLWPRIAQGIRTQAPGAAAVRPAPASASAPEKTGLLMRLWSSLAALRVAAAGGAFATLVLAVVALATLRHASEVEARKPVYVAILIDDASRQAGAVVNAFADGRVEMIPLVDMAVPSGRALQVWTLWNREVGPRPVGLLQRAQATRLDLERLPATTADQLFEITLEPAGGSPTGRPTGPILYKGTTARTL